ncbi:MAG: glycosyltransferase, partial [Nitrososphaera sp.]|nr:glycosyltransferase [Nitrososphaera sp.]
MTVNLTLQRRGLLLIPLVLSGFTHLWNPAGFPDIFFDEGVYMRRAIHVIEGLGPQESYFHDHPFFGQLFLAGALILTGFPGSSGTDADSISALYTVPRVLMGLLAIADTFLVFKITERKYGRNIALLASVLFAVMPITWLLRRILLDSILLPLVLSSIFFAMQSSTTGKRRIAFVLLSGAFLGLAVFTKIPAVIMMPVVGYLVLSSKDSRRLARLG